MSLRKGEYNDKAAFVALKYNLQLGGKMYQAGDTIDTSNISSRKKMQLFNAKIIGYDYMAPKPAQPKEEAVPKKSTPKKSPVAKKGPVKTEDKKED